MLLQFRQRTITTLIFLLYLINMQNDSIDNDYDIPFYFILIRDFYPFCVKSRINLLDGMLASKIFIFFLYLNG